MIDKGIARQLIVDAVALAGGPIRGAAFKQRCLRRVSPKFDERQLGFRTLRAFLEAFPDVVRVEHDGIDIVVHARDDQPADARPATVKTIRADMWRAFTFVHADTVRYYDRDAQKAVLLSREVAAPEPPDIQDLRQRIEATPTKFVKIESVDPAEQLELMRRFAAGVSDSKVKGELEEALAAKYWFRSFTKVVERNPAVHHQWRVQWADFIFERIRQWSETHQIDVPSLLSTVPAIPKMALPPALRSTKRAATQGAEHINVNIEELRAVVVRAVRAMSPAQLLALAIPLEYMNRND